MLNGIADPLVGISYSPFGRVQTQVRGWQTQMANSSYSIFLKKDAQTRSEHLFLYI
ncbi:hypothetical protein [Bacillus salipaludis]|uniref:hypothetical protein n=1 Tax=Bacillus salipaludis TaxID=2547811 RepID=UPI001404A257|nr:hypothetical protein [Bacillus salipaludis]